MQRRNILAVDLCQLCVHIRSILRNVRLILSRVDEKQERESVYILDVYKEKLPSLRNVKGLDKLVRLRRNRHS